MSPTFFRNLPAQNINVQSALFQNVLISFASNCFHHMLRADYPGTTTALPHNEIQLKFNLWLIVLQE